MKKLVLGLAGILAAASLAEAQDKRINIPPAEVPKAIADLIKKFVPEGSITEATKRTKDGVEEYRLRIFVAARIVEAEFEVEPNEGPQGGLELPVSEVELPKAVAEAFKKALPDAFPAKGRKVIVVDSEHPEGEITYEWKAKDPKRNVVISADGATVTTYQRIKEEELPQPVRDALAKDFAGTAFGNMDKVTLNGAVTYEIEVDGGDDLVATADGKVTVRDE